MINNVLRLNHPAVESIQQGVTDQPTNITGQTFGHHLQTAIEQLNDLQLESDMKTNKLVNGEAIDLHNVMVTAQKASIALETSVQIQRKVIDAYNEVMRMQV